MADTTSWRDWLNRNPRLVIALAGIVIAAGLAYLVFPSRRYRGPTEINVYFYDLGAKTLFTVSGSELPPIDTPSGKGMGVAAVVFGCGDCAPGHRFVAYLQRFKPEFRQGQIADWEQQRKRGEETLRLRRDLHDFLEVRAVEDGPWVAYNSDAGRALTDPENVLKRCAGGKLVPCNPGD
jgi:hypothetical protein